MISIVIASVNPQHLEGVKKNILQTIGVPHEIISFNNADGSKGLSELYNQGAQKAKYNLICFMHEDVSIKTDDWGAMVVKAFDENIKLGLLGALGSKYKSISPSGWSCYGLSAERGSVVQQFKHKKSEQVFQQTNPENVPIENVVCVDGFWFCTRKKLALKFKFDQETFKGFHCYDIDYSLSIYQHFQVQVIHKILIEHFSEGCFDKEWMQEVVKLHKKWNHVLPLNSNIFNKKESKIVEKRTFKNFIDKGKSLGFDIVNLFPLLWQVRFVKGAGLSTFLKLNIYLIDKIIRKSKSS